MATDRELGETGILEAFVHGSDEPVPVIVISCVYDVNVLTSFLSARREAQG
jgi:hypothetical protein